MKGARVLQVMGFLLLGLGGVGIVFQMVNEASPVMWLGAIGPIVMGSALLVVSRALRKEGS